MIKNNNKIKFNNKTKNTYYGKLIYDEHGDYQLISPTGSTNISEILDRVYDSNNSNKKYIEVKVMNGCKILFNEQGNLLRKPDQYGVFAYHINGECLELVLFMNVDKYVDIEILADALGNGDRYGAK